MDVDELTEVDAGRGVDRAALLRRIAAGGAALSVPALLAANDAIAAPAIPNAGGGGNYPSHPKWKFAFINHVTTNPFFVPTQPRSSTLAIRGAARRRPTSARC